MLFGIVADGNITNGRSHQDSFGAFQRAEHDLNGEAASILAQPVQFNSRANLLRQRLGRGAGSVGDQPFRKAFGNDVRDLLAQKLIAAVAELLLRLGIEQDNLSVLIHDYHSVRSRLQQPAVPCLRLLVLGQVAADFRKPAQVSGGIAQRDEGDAGQKLGPISAHVHAIFFVAAVCGSQAEHLFRSAPPDIFLKKEAGKVVADDLFGGIPLNMLRAGAPTDDLASRVQHEDRVVMDSVQEHPVLFFALLEQFLGSRTSRAVTHRGPGRDAGDQDPQQGSKKQDALGQAQVVLSACQAERPQAHFLGQHSADQRLELGVPFLRPTSNGIHRGREALCPAQIDDHIRALDSLGGQDFKVGKMGLLRRVIRRQDANGGLILRHSGDVGPVGLQIRIHAGYHKPAGVGFDTFHGQGQILDVVYNVVGMQNPAVAFV